MHRFLYILFFLLFSKFSLIAQTEVTNVLTAKDTLKNKEINMLAPSKAAFYSALFPGMGQVYNKKYWKLPIVYGALGASIYFYINNNKKYNIYRNAYKRRLEGYSDDDFQYLDDQRLIKAQKFYQSNRDLSALITSLFYILNIVDANVDAHLMQFNVNDNLTFKPEIYRDGLTYKQNLGFTLSYNFR